MNLVKAKEIQSKYLEKPIETLDHACEYGEALGYIEHKLQVEETGILEAANRAIKHWDNVIGRSNPAYGNGGIASISPMTILMDQLEKTIQKLEKLNGKE